MVCSTVTHFQRTIGDVSVRIITDPPGPSESPALEGPRVAMHLGRSVQMACHRGGLKHRGLAVHGDLDIIPAHTSCLWVPEGSDTALIVSIAPKLLERTANELGFDLRGTAVVNRFQVRDAQIEHLCSALKVEMEAGCPTGRVFLDSLSTALAAALLQRHSSAAGPALTMSRASMSACRLRHSLSYIEDNLSGGLTLANIADAAGLSVSHFKTTFRKMTGVPVHQYVIQRRVERAATLLADGALSIAQVAAATGFAHQSHLARHMRRILGCPPTGIAQLSQIGQLKRPEDDDSWRVDLTS